MSLDFKAKLLSHNTKGYTSETGCLPEMHKALDLVLVVKEKAPICKSQGHNFWLYQLLCTKFQQLSNRYLVPLSVSSPLPAKVTITSQERKQLQR